MIFLTQYMDYVPFFTESIQKGDFFLVTEVKYFQKSNVLHSRKKKIHILFLKHSSDPTHMIKSSPEWLNMAYIQKLILFLLTL